MASHADNHDRDKLTGWQRDRSSGEGTGFPVYAVFLVTPEDRPAHDIFRAYRNSFGERGAAFHHLMIFGQHGISTTVRGLLSEFGLELNALPVLALFTDSPGDAVYTIGLRTGDYATGEKGEVASLAGPWMDVLGFLENAVDAKDGRIGLQQSGVLAPLKLGTGTMDDVIERVLGQVC